jgi:hypothetical protein
MENAVLVGAHTMGVIKLVLENGKTIFSKLPLNALNSCGAILANSGQMGFLHELTILPTLQTIVSVFVPKYRCLARVRVWGWNAL